MEIADYQKVSFIDYPGKIATVLFCPYCNLRCPYCHNPELIFFKGNVKSESEIFMFLKSRINKIEAVVITGGEPTLQIDLPDFIKKIKAMDFLVKLDTNGHKPLMIKEVMNVVDMIALDIKATFSTYKTFGGNGKLLEESLDILKDYDGFLQLRTTLYPPFTSEKDLEEMKKFIPNDLKYEWQFNPYRSEKTLKQYMLKKGYLAETHSIANLSNTQVSKVNSG